MSLQGLILKLYSALRDGLILYNNESVLNYDYF